MKNRNRHIAAVLIAAAGLLLTALPAAAQWIPCLNDPLNSDQSPLLPRIPELISADGKLRATVVLTDETQRMTFRDPANNRQGDTIDGKPKSLTRCAPQHVRSFKGINAVPPYPAVPAGGIPDPMPGPTLRAKVGDIIELTFLNQVNPANFTDSIDRGDLNTGTGCDEANVGQAKVGYPGGDRYPNCFHGSSTANIHFHGTHTNPNSTADNVFIEVRPSPRVNGKPIVTEDLVRPFFDAFFKDCEAALGANPLYEWPRTWADMPYQWTGVAFPNTPTPLPPLQPYNVKALLQAYDKQPGIKPLWPVNQINIDKQLWPQYYIGSFPHCFRLPEYKLTTWPPPATSDAVHTPQSHGAGAAEQQAKGSGEAVAGPTRPLLMGQAPGTHWYHAHKHGSTAIDVLNGMTGAFIIEGDYDKQLDAFYQDPGWTRRQPVMVINQLGDLPNLEHGNAQHVGRGPDFSVNGRLNPKVVMRPGEVQLWRIVNTSSRAGVFFGQPAGLRWKQMAQDGVQFNVTNYRNGNTQGQSFLLAAGNRADLLVKAPPVTGRYPVLVQNEIDPSQLSTANKVTLLTVEVSSDTSNTTPLHTSLLPPLTASEPDSSFPLTFPPFLQDIDSSEVSGTKKIMFATQPQVAPPATSAVHTIDGKQFDGEVGAVVLLNRVEEWQIFNATSGISHPFHIHINPFQVTEVFDPTVKLPGTTTPKYVTDRTGMAAGQCYLNPARPEDPAVYFPNDPNVPVLCAPPAPTPLPRIWWDVFPIPSGIKAVNAAGEPLGKDGKVIPFDQATKVPNDPTAQAILPGYFKMRSRFVDFPGYYVIHCHILAHEDRGMMTVVEVAPLSSPYSHH
jgi:FtsP/CotA-like multicopper oxidase with cupredoxin domain